MSTVLTSLAVTVAAIASVLAIVFSQSDQPATLRRPSRRGHHRRRQPPTRMAGRGAPKVSAPSGPPSAPVPTRGPDFVPPEPARSLRPDGSWIPVAPVTRWDRLRSGFALVVMLTVVGTLLAIAIGTALVVAGLNLRDALRGS